MHQPPNWYDHNADNPPWIKALAEVRHLACRERWCYHHVQAIIVSIDQYAESALGNRDFFLNKPHSIGGSRKAMFRENWPIINKVGDVRNTGAELMLPLETLI